MVLACGIGAAGGGGMGVRRFTDLRAWQAADVFKKSVLILCKQGSLSTDLKLRQQLEDAVLSPPAQIAEGFGRFSPADFARFCVIARGSVMEVQAHLRTAVDKGYILEVVRLEHDRLGDAALGEITGLVKYPQSPAALAKARGIRNRQAASQHQEPEPEP